MDFKNTGLSSLGFLEFTTGEFTVYYISPLPHPQLCSLSHRQLWLTGATSWNEHPAEDPPSPRAASQVCLLLQLSNSAHSKNSNSVLSLKIAAFCPFSNVLLLYKLCCGHQLLGEASYPQKRG